MIRIKNLFALWLFLVNIKGNGAILLCEEWKCRSEVQNLQDYVAIKTTPGENLSPVVDLFKRLAARQNVEITVFEGKPNYPVIVLKWPGLDPKLKSIILLTSMDAAPACYEDGWTYPPFSGDINDNCEIVGRGAQATKTAGIQQYEALSCLKRNNETLLRDVYMIITPDETTGSLNGIALFVKSQMFQDMNVGFAVGIGAVNVNSNILVFYRSKTKYIIRVDCYGQSLFSARLPDINTTATGTCGKFFNSIIQYREEQYQLSLNASDFGDYTAINYLGGRALISFDLIPAHVVGYYVINLARDTSFEEFNELLRGWVSEAGGNITISSVYKLEQNLMTKIDDSNPYWVAVRDGFGEQNITVQLTTALTTLDATFVVRAGIPALSFLANRNTPVLSNAVDESLPLSAFFEGIRNYEAVIRRLANLSDEEVEHDSTTYLEEPTDG